MPTVAKDIKIFAGGVDLSCALTEINSSQVADALDSTALCTTGAKSFVSGLKEDTLSMTGMFDYSPTGYARIHNILDAALDPATTVVGAAGGLITTIFADGNTMNAPARLMLSAETKHETSAKVGGIIMSSADFKARSTVINSQGLRRGAIVFPYQTISGGVGFAAYTGGKDDAAGTDNGGVLHVHSFDTGSATNGVTGFHFQHSADNFTWVDLLDAGYVQIISKTALRFVFAGGIKRYVRFYVNTQDNGDSIVAAAFARL